MNSASTGASQPSASASQPSATSAAPPDGSGAPQSAARTKGRELIDAVKTLGYFPKEAKSAGPEEKALAKNIRRCQFTPAERIEIDGLRRTSVHPRDRARSAKLLEEAQESANPMEGFAGEAGNRLDQDLLQLASGNCARDLQRRLKKYQKLIADADAANTEFAQKYKEQILNAAAQPVADF